MKVRKAPVHHLILACSFGGLVLLQTGCRKGVNDEVGWQPRSVTTDHSAWDYQVARDTQATQSNVTPGPTTKVVSIATWAGRPGPSGPEPTTGLGIQMTEPSVAPSANAVANTNSIFHPVFN